jgi:hypothetical protein
LPNRPSYFLFKSYYPTPWRDSISRTIAPNSNLVGRDDTNTPRRSAYLFTFVHRQQKLIFHRHTLPHFLSLFIFYISFYQHLRVLHILAVHFRMMIGREGLGGIQVDGTHRNNEPFRLLSHDSKLNDLISRGEGRRENK